MIKSRYFKKKENDREIRYQVIDGVTFKDYEGDDVFNIRTLYYDDVRNRITDIKYAICLEKFRGYACETLITNHGYEEISQDEYVHEILDFYEEDYEP